MAQFSGLRRIDWRVPCQVSLCFPKSSPKLCGSSTEVKVACRAASGGWVHSCRPTDAAFSSCFLRDHTTAALAYHRQIGDKPAADGDAAFYSTLPWGVLVCGPSMGRGVFTAGFLFLFLPVPRASKIKCFLVCTTAT